MEHLTQRNKHTWVLSEPLGVTDGLIWESAESDLQDRLVTERTASLFGRGV